MTEKEILSHSDDDPIFKIITQGDSLIYVWSIEDEDISDEMITLSERLGKLLINKK